MAAHKVFADTSSLYALVDRRDRHHDKAKKAVEGLVRGGGRLVTTDYVVAETLNLANARRGKHVGIRLLDLLDSSSGISVEWIGPERFSAARAFFRRHADHAYSFTDCTSFVVMRELRLRDALTSDAHFSEAGFRALLAS
jgi:uncharacterized protein